MADSGEMLVCVHNNCDCEGRVEWEHSWLYAGKRINEKWAIIPCCYMHHRGGLLDKDYNRYCSLKKAFKLYGDLRELFKKYPKKNWIQEWAYLKQKYEK